MRFASVRLLLSTCPHHPSAAKTTALLLVVGLAMVGVSLGPRRAHADDSVPAARQVVILMRALAYDGNLKSRAGNTVNIAILHKKGNATSDNMASSMTKAFRALESTQVSGLPIAVSRLSYSGGEALKKAISGTGVDFVYVCSGLEEDLAAIEEVTRQMKVLSVGSEPQHVQKGLSIGVFQIEGKCTILLNLSACRQEGVSFAADLLRLSKVIR